MGESSINTPSRNFEEENHLELQSAAELNREEYEKLHQEYANKANDLENKCTVLHKKLEEVKEAWESAKKSRDSAFKEKEAMTLKFALSEKRIIAEMKIREELERKYEILTRNNELLQAKLKTMSEEKNRICLLYDEKVNGQKAAKSEIGTIKNDNLILTNELKLCQKALKNQAELYQKSQSTIEELKIKLDEINKEEIDLNNHDVNSKLQEFDECKEELQEMKNKLEICEGKWISTENRNRELEIQFKTIREKEKELLSFTRHLTGKNVELQSQVINLNCTIQQLLNSKSILKSENEKITTEYKNLMEQFKHEKEDHSRDLEEIKLLKSNLSHQNIEILQLEQQLSDQVELLNLTKKKHRIAVKEMRKEIRDQRNFSSSNTSISSFQIHNNLNRNNNIQVLQPEGIINRKIFIERIVKLQRIIAKQSENIDYLENQMSVLIFEMQKKSKLLQMYMLREQSGVLTTKQMDDTKLNLAALSGVMASIFGGRVVDKNLTLELSLEINRKLQAVLEDALLTNVILKKNIDTLGREIENLNTKLKG